MEKSISRDTWARKQIVFVGSSMDEFSLTRRLIKKRLEEVIFDVFIYEDVWPAGSKPVIESALRRVESSDFFVGLFGKRFPEFTTKEFKIAKKRGLPCLIYIKGRDWQDRDLKLEEFLGNEITDPVHGVSYVYFEDEINLPDRVLDDVWQNIQERLAALDEHDATGISGRSRPFPHPGSRLSPHDLFKLDLRRWFEALKYRFTDHNVMTEQYFEWCVEIPSSISSDRILVRGLNPEMGVADPFQLHGLRESVQRHGAHKGWLVSLVRPGSVGSSDVGDPDEALVSAFTFDDLIAKEIQFDRYFAWLESEIEHLGIRVGYVPITAARKVIERNRDLFFLDDSFNEKLGGTERYITQWLHDPTREHISILGEFGTGKTWFTLHYAWEALIRYRRAIYEGEEPRRIPLYIPLRRYRGRRTLEKIIQQFFDSFKIPLRNFDIFARLSKMGRLLLIFDGFDEMSEQRNLEKMASDFRELARSAVSGSKIILTSRKEVFPQIRDIRDLLLDPIAPFEILELGFFSETQIREVFKRRGASSKIDFVVGNPDLMDLARRPVMIDFILKGSHELLAGKEIDIAHIFLYAVTQNLKTSAARAGNVTLIPDKLYFLCELSWLMMKDMQNAFHHREINHFVNFFFGEVQDKAAAEVDAIFNDLIGNAMLVHSDDGYYSLAHRSLGEFFVAFKMVAELGLLKKEFTDLARDGSEWAPDAAPRRQTWSAYFRQHKPSRDCPPLEEFVMEADSPARGSPVDGWNMTSLSLVIAAQMIRKDSEALGALCTAVWKGTYRVSRTAAALLPFLKNLDGETARRLASSLLAAGSGEPMRNGITWVLGELGVATDDVVEALRKTVQTLGPGGHDNAWAWWEAAFSLEKLDQLEGPSTRPGDRALRYLRDHLSTGNRDVRKAIANLEKDLRFRNDDNPGLDHRHIVTIAAYAGEADKEELISVIKRSVDPSGDTISRHVYYPIWILGHLQIREAIDLVIDATAHPHASVRNCAGEALGKIGVNSPKVVDALTGLLDDHYYRTRLHAVSALGVLGATSALNHLKTALFREEVRDVHNAMRRVINKLEGL